MIVSCTSALAMFIGMMSFGRNNIQYDVKNCTLNLNTGRSWVEMNWKFNPAMYSGTSGRLTVNQYLESNCHLKKDRTEIYVDDRSQMLSMSELDFANKYKMYMTNGLNFFMAEFCYSKKYAKK